MLHSITKEGGSRRFSALAIHNDVVHLAGQVSQLKTADIKEQTRDVFAKVDALLLQANAEVGDVLSVQVWLANMDDYEGFNAVWDEWVDGAAPPTRVCVEARLAKPHYKIEVLVVAVRGGAAQHIPARNGTVDFTATPEHIV